MVFGVDELIVYLSSLMTLSPGDLILTGTPEGVGLGRKPPRFLQAGDVVTVGIDGIGSFSNRFVPGAP
jgi:2-keto-4-pentenoate hydratase/2-oxohepta-3-ene-1,7-dioic acid hydratase in catechol pathway